MQYRPPLQPLLTHRRHESWVRPEIGCRLPAFVIRGRRWEPFRHAASPSIASAPRICCESAPRARTTSCPAPHGFPERRLARPAPPWLDMTLEHRAGERSARREVSIRVPTCARPRRGLLQHMEQLAFRSEGRASSRETRRSLRNSGRIRSTPPNFEGPNLTAIGAVDVGRCSPKFVGPASTEFGASRPNFGPNSPTLRRFGLEPTRYGPMLASFGPESSRFDPISTSSKFGPESTNFCPIPPEFGPNAAYSEF